ncbi:8877_t:CDS:2 [Entrophospora sp. SA101]|nr:8877_t:CDS:2 [Entrophospora sp. SA101]
MLSFDYDALQREITNIDNTDDDYCDDEILENNEDAQENLSGEAEFDMEVPKEIKSKVTPCVIVDNENNEEKIERCNHMDNNNRGEETSSSTSSIPSPSPAAAVKASSSFG